MRIYLIGYMGSGKTTTGKKLADRLEYGFVDLDDMIENKYRISIPYIFDKYDENAFRKLEKETLSETFGADNIVVATGGGTPCFFNNMEKINSNGVSVYLSMESNSLMKRLLRAKRKRPLLSGKNPDELLTFIKTQLEWREPFYLKAKIIINGDNPDIDLLEKQVQKFK